MEKPNVVEKTVAPRCAMVGASRAVAARRVNFGVCGCGFVGVTDGLRCGWTRVGDDEEMGCLFDSEGEGKRMAGWASMVSGI